jgi:phosphoribosylaminoimidazole (AIR) synthetase
MAVFGALGGIEDEELRATFNGGLGMVVVVAPEALFDALAAFPDALLVGEVATASELGGRYAEGRLEGAWPEAVPVGLR